jgi:pimeloyl-ACP methyl ester carboxylesterase
MNRPTPALRRSAHLLLCVGLVFAALLAAPLRASAQSIPVTTINGTLPAFTVPGLPPAPATPYRIVVPTNPAQRNGMLIMDLDFVGNGVGASYANLYDRGYAAAGIQRIAFNLGGRDSRVSAIQLLQVQDIYNSVYGKPQFTITNGGSTGGVFSGYMLEHFPDRFDGAVANCTEPGYVGWQKSTLQALFAGEVLLSNFFNGPPPGLVSVAGTGADAAAWTAAINAAQATPEGKARIALALSMGQMNTWTTGTRPDFTDVDQVQQAMYDSLRILYSDTVPTHHNQELQVGNQSFLWTYGYDYKKMFKDNIRPEQREAILHYYALAGLDLQADLNRLNSAPRIAANPDAVAEINLHGDYSGNPTKPFLMNNLIGDPLVNPAPNQGYVDRAVANGKGDLVRYIHVDGTGHCGFRPNESVAAIEVMYDRLRTGVWPSTTAADLNARATALNLTPAQAPRFIDYQDGPYEGWFGTGDTYHIVGCASPQSGNVANGMNRASPDNCPQHP